MFEIYGLAEKMVEVTGKLHPNVVLVEQWYGFSKIGKVYCPVVISHLENLFDM